MMSTTDNAKSGAVGGWYPKIDSSFTDGLKAALEAVQDATEFDPIQDFKSIVKDDICFEAYKGLLFQDVLGDLAGETAMHSDMTANCENADMSYSALSAASNQADWGYMATNQDKLNQMVENTRDELALEASTVGQLQPIVALTMPLMKKAFIKMAYKDAYQTLTADKMLINIGYERDFLKDIEGKKYYIPELYYPENEDTFRAVQTGMVGKPISNLLYPKTGVLPFQDLDLLGESKGSLRTRDALGYDLAIVGCTMKVKCPKSATDPDAVDATKFDASGYMVVPVTGMNIKPNLQTGTFRGKVTTPSLLKSVTDPTEDRILGEIDFYAGKVSISTTSGIVQQVKFGGHLSSANNDVGVEIDRERFNIQIPIPEQERLNTGLTVEKIKDEKALQNIDVTVDTVSRLSDAAQQIQDVNSKLFLEDSFQAAVLQDGSNNPMGYTVKLADSIKFPLTQPSTYLLPESEWRTAQLHFYLSKYILKFVQKLRSEEMMVVMVANPTIINYLDDVKWVVNDESKVGGVKLDYKFGVTSVANVRVHVISTQKETDVKGFRLIAYPLTDKIITYRKYNYSFFIENNYRNQNTPLTPNVMVAQRYLNYEYLPMQSEFYFEEFRNGKAGAFVPMV